MRQFYYRKVIQNINPLNKIDTKNSTIKKLDAKNKKIAKRIIKNLNKRSSTRYVYLGKVRRRK